MRAAFKIQRIAAVVLFAAALISGPGPAPGADIVDLGVITSQAEKPAGIAIPAMLPAASSGARAQEGFLRDVIYKDLEFSGYFERAKNQQFVEQQHRADLKGGDIRSTNIDFAEWGRLGVQFLLRGEYKLGLDRKTLQAEVFLFDVSGNLIFGRKYTDATLGAYRTLAHRIADDIVLHVKGWRGIASTRILFISDRTGASEVWIMDANGDNQQQVTHFNNLVLAPSWGANSTEIYYTTYHKRNPDLYGQIIRTGKFWPISRFGGLNVSADWNEEAGRLVLTLGKDGNSEIYSMERSGKGLRRLTKNLLPIDSSPSWSPDGRTIYFTSNRNGSPQIFRMDADGGNQKRVTWQGSYNDGAQASPDGSRVAFSGRDANRNFHVFVMDADGKNWVQVTSGNHNNQDPTWAPDGRHLAFVSDRTGRKQIYVVDAETGLGLQQLTTKGRQNRMPAWSPFFD